jgi:hypothetical protein
MRSGAVLAGLSILSLAGMHLLRAANPPVVVRLIDGNGAPVAGRDVLLCPGGGPRCTAAATTARDGIARFNGVPAGIIGLEVRTTGCESFRAEFDSRKSTSGVPFTLIAPPFGTLRLKVVELQPDGTDRPLEAKKAEFILHPAPPKPNGVGVSQRSFTLPKATDVFDMCVNADTGYDVEIRLPDHYLGSAHAPPIKALETRVVRLSVRPKPKP